MALTKKKTTISPHKEFFLVFLNIESTAVVNRSRIIYTDKTKYTCLPDLYLLPLSLFNYKAIFSCRIVISDQ